MNFNLLVLLFLGLCLCALQASAGNPDILWQKTLIADTLPIRSIAVAESKYVAALKGNQIIILDYGTGDSIKSFTAPKEMYGNDIILGKGGERLYVFVVSSDKSFCWMRAWDIATGVQLKDINMESLAGYGVSAHPTSYIISSSLNGKIIAVQTTLKIYSGSSYETRSVTSIFNTNDSTIKVRNSIKPDITFSHYSPKDQGDKLLSGTIGMHVSQSGNYVEINTSVDGFYSQPGGPGKYYSYQNAYITSLIPALASYGYNSTIPSYTFSHDDDFLLLGNQLYDLPPTRVLRSITKTGFAFLPDDNHLLAFKAGGGVAAISNIERDTWEKVFYGDSLTENLIQPGAKFVSFATATNARITLWKIPDTLQAATLSVDFTMTKDTISLGDTVSFSNKTYPFKRGNMYQWHFGDSLASSAEIHPKHVFAQKGNYTILLQVRDTLGRISSISKSITVQNPTDVLEANPLHATALSISPNPSYTETQIHITLAQASNYNVRIMDNLGREIARWEEHSSTGEHVILWNENVPSGVYYCTLSVGGEVRMVPFVVVR